MCCVVDGPQPLQPPGLACSSLAIPCSAGKLGVPLSYGEGGSGCSLCISTSSPSVVLLAVWPYRHSGRDWGGALCCLANGQSSQWVAQAHCGSDRRFHHSLWGRTPGCGSLEQSGVAPSVSAEGCGDRERLGRPAVGRASTASAVEPGLMYSLAPVSSSPGASRAPVGRQPERVAV